MTGLDDRKNAFENKFAHDEELRFKAMARRNKLLGLWAAEQMGKSGDAAEAYAKEVILSDFEEAGDEDVFRKVRADFDAAGVALSDHQVRRTMDELLATAIDQIQNAQIFISLNCEAGAAAARGSGVGVLYFKRCTNQVIGVVND